MKRLIIPIAAVLFILAAGTFGTLWALERSDHSKKAEELSGLRTEIDNGKSQLAEAEKTQAEWVGKVADAATASRKAENEYYKYMSCAIAARKWLKVPAAERSVSQEKLDDFLLLCRDNS